MRPEQFEQFVWPHLSLGRRGPPPTLALHKIFNYILQALYMGCQWKMLPIDRNPEGHPEIHYTRIYRTFRRWQADGCIDAIFSGSVQQLHQDQLLDLSVIRGDRTTTAAKKGGDNLGYSGHKHLKPDEKSNASTSFASPGCQKKERDAGTLSLSRDGQLT